jgi:hypothetical protein
MLGSVSPLTRYLWLVVVLIVGVLVAAAVVGYATGSSDSSGTTLPSGTTAAP